MSTQLRHVLIGLAVAAVVVLRIASMGSGHAKPAAPQQLQPFPERIVAQADRLPAYADGAQTRIRQQFDSANAMWQAVFAAAGTTYEPPRLVDSGCSPPSTGWAGVYCLSDATIQIDVNGHIARHTAVGSGLEDVVLAYVVAHEVGHHVQSLRGAPIDARLQRELHADCLAGIWGKAAGMPLPPMWMYGEDATHGTAAQQVQWLNVGYASARPADCDAIWSGSTTP